MRRTATILGLLALLALVPCTECVAQSQPASPTSTVAAATSPIDLAEFLATLSGSQTSTSLNFQYITCTDDEDCPQGQLCCYPCGIDGCNFVCMDPDRRGRCPIIP